MTGLIMTNSSKKKVFLSLKGIGQQSVCRVWEFWIYVDELNTIK